MTCMEERTRQIDRQPSVWTELIQRERDAAIQQERRRFAQELHDVVASGMQCAILHACEARDALSPGEARAQELLAIAMEDMQNCWSEARRCAAGLRPVELDQRGIAAALYDHVARIAENSQVSIACNIRGNAATRSLSPAVELALLRIVKEAVANALRHASARNIIVELCFDKESLWLEVADNGRGFDSSAAHDGSGMDGMRERAERIGAELSILSGENMGTRVILTLPTKQPQVLQ